MDDIYFLFLWYLLLTVVSFVSLHSDSFVFLQKINKEVRAERGILLVQLIATWLLILVPSYVYDNTLQVWKDIVEPNVGTVSLLALCLVLASLLIPYNFHLRREGNNFGASLTLLLVVLSFVAFAIILVVVLPLEVRACRCKDGYFGVNCENSCFSSDNKICSGHGTCSDGGCVCDERFTGTLCDSCINEYLYSSDCSTCRNGYSLLLDCTACSVGRDKNDDCQSCIDSYIDKNTSDCVECQPFFFKASSLPSRSSYNAFLKVGSDVCQPCPNLNNKVCNGHGTCNHYQLEVDGVKLAEDASGLCDCDAGYAGPFCERIPGFDLENTESICNGNGDAYAVFEVPEGQFFEEYKELLCECDNGWYPTFSSADSACSEKQDVFGAATECVYGYYLNVNTTRCLACPGGGFLQGCNAINQGGYCLEDGTCQCQINYSPTGNGGYKGDDCKTCADNFYKENNKCRPCPRANGPLVTDSCSGKGYCMTEERIEKWKASFGHDTTSADSYHVYQSSVDEAVSLENLNQYIGKCLCKSGYSNILDGSCN